MRLGQEPVRGRRDIAGQVRPAVKLPLVFATDGSAQLVDDGGKKYARWFMGWGWIATDGQWAIGAYEMPTYRVGTEASTVAELRGIWHVLKSRLDHEPVALHLDSDSAVRYLEQWARGELTMPAGYVGSVEETPTLVRLARLVSKHHPSLSWTIVKGHSGDLLNEAADSLARIGRDWCTGLCGRDVATERASRLAEGFLTDRRLAVAE